MASAGGLTASVQFVGGELARRQLAEQGKKIDPVLRGSLNSTATKTRTERYINPMRGAIKPVRLRAAMKVKRANTRRLNSRIIPSSSGITLLNYNTWGYDAIDATRARLWVRGPTGRKVAAGFINPSSAQRLPWDTRSKRARQAPAMAWAHRRLAIGPSAAYWFKNLTDTQTIRWVNTYLQQEFARRMRKELR